ncbi:MAG: ribbon-helix-helix protein, CopG family, partial [Promethearchaeota archaeon]
MSDEYKRFTVSLPKTLYQEFEKFRKKLEVSRSDAVRKAMHRYMAIEESLPESAGDVVGCIA